LFKDRYRIRLVILLFVYGLLFVFDGKFIYLWKGAVVNIFNKLKYFEKNVQLRNVNKKSRKSFKNLFLKKV
jgi:hypothetical protein